MYFSAKDFLKTKADSKLEASFGFAKIAFTMDTNQLNQLYASIVTSCGSCNLVVQTMVVTKAVTKYRSLCYSVHNMYFSHQMFI